MAREATEIQNIEIADGPICHGWPIPVYMIFPRLFTCPTVSTRNFKVDFEVNLGKSLRQLEAQIHSLRM